MNDPAGIEHDTLQENPHAARGRPERSPERLGRRDQRRQDIKADAARTGRPWCAFDNPEIWTVIAGEADDE